MLPRRSARAASVQPKQQSQTVDTAEKAEQKARGRKRAASPTPRASSRKRVNITPQSSIENMALESSGESQNPLHPVKTAKARAARAEPAEKRENQPRKLKGKEASISDLSQHIQLKPYFNPLPQAPPRQRPGLQLFIWGAGNFGQFGMGPDFLDEVTKPKRNTWMEQQMQKGKFGEPGSGFESAVAGGTHSVFVDEKGTVWTCGVNDEAALGRETTNVPDPEHPDTMLDIDNLTSIPHPLNSLVEENFRAVKILAGDNYSAALSAEGELRVWGSFRSSEGSLGFADGTLRQFRPVSILDLPRKAGDHEKISDVAGGWNHLVVLTTHGNVYTWGAGDVAQLGRKIIERRKIHGTNPEKVVLGSRSRKAVAVGSGAYHSFAIDDKGDVWAWGLNSVGQLGTGYGGEEDMIVQLPKKVQGLSKAELCGDVVKIIEGGEHHTLFLTESGKVYVVGRAENGQLGLPKNHMAFQDRKEGDFIDVPTLLTFPEDDDPIVSVSAGPRYSLAISKDGAMFSWGTGVQGELGAGDDDEVHEPRVIVRREGGSWAAVSASGGGQHALGLFKKKN